MLFSADFEGKILKTLDDERRYKNPMEDVEFAKQGLLLNEKQTQSNYRSKIKSVSSG